MFPLLSAWMANARSDHYLRDVFDGAESSDHPTSWRRTILTAFNDIIAALDGRPVPAVMLAVQSSLLKAARTHDLRRVLTFHRRVLNRLAPYPAHPRSR